MGEVNTVSFDEGWLFARYGLQPDGTRKEEPSGLEAASFNDAAWQKLKLPHDWAITGPFRIELDGSTGKLPWKGIGWYRKHFTVPATDAGKQIFVDFDGAMANAKIWLNGKYVGDLAIWIQFFPDGSDAFYSTWERKYFGCSS